MKSIFLILLACWSILLIPTKQSSMPVAAEVSSISATSYIVMEKSSQKILEGTNYHEVRSVASISKIMTAIVAIENASLQDKVVIPEEINQVYGSMLYIKSGDEYPLIDLLYGLMLRSGNDAAISIAIHVGGTVEQFVNLMNQKAGYLGMNDTLFRNPHGLDEIDGGNLSSAYDMSILQSYALHNPVYRLISQAKSYHTYTNKNRLLHQYDCCTGGKTGFTTKARRTLVSSAKKDDLELVIVTLNCGNDFYTHRFLYEKYFAEYIGLIALKQGKNYIDNYTLTVSQDYIFMVLKEQSQNLYLHFDIQPNSKKVTIYLMNQQEKIDEMCISLSYKVKQKDNILC